MTRAIIGMLLVLTCLPFAGCELAGSGESEPPKPSILALLKDLSNDADERKQYHAYAGLSKMGPEILPDLLHVLDDKQSPLRGAAAEALAAVPFRSPAAIPSLLSAARERDDLKTSCFKALTRFDPSPKQLAPLLVENLDSSRPRACRLAAIDGLKSIAAEDTTTIQSLQACLKGRDVDIKLSALSILKTIGLEGKPASREVIALLSSPNVNVWCLAAKCLVQIDPTKRGLAIEVLVRSAKNSDSMDRRIACTCLGEIGATEPQAIKQLAKLLKDEETREDAASALERIGNAAGPAVPALLKVLNDGPDPAHSLSVADAVTKIMPKDPRVVAAVVRFATRFVKDTENAKWDWGRRNALYDVGLLGTAANDAVPLLGEMLKDNIASVRIAAAQAIVEVGGDSKKALPVLIKSLEVVDIREGIYNFPGTNAEGARALGRLGPGAREAGPALVKFMKAGAVSGENRLAAAEALLRIDLDAYAETVISDLVGLAQEDFTPDACDAIDVLGHVGPKAVPVLVNLLKDPRRGRMAAAAQALAHIGWPAATTVPALCETLKDERASVRRAAVEALRAIDPRKALKLFQSALNDPAWSVRLAAVQGLAAANTSGRDNTDALRLSLNDPDADVRDAAVTALKSLAPGKR